jgi:penicillin-binding protein 1C
MQIAFPANGALLESERDAAGAMAPVAIKIVGGTPPFRLLADGRPQESVARTRQFFWTPEGPGTARLTVLDVTGRTQTVSVVVR